MPAFALIWLWLWPTIGRLLIPFHKMGNSTEVGFTSLNSLWTSSGWAGIVFQRFIMPLFATIYIINLLLIEAVSVPRALNEARDIYFMIGMWLFVMLMTGSAFSLIAMILGPFTVGYFIGGQSIYSGCIGVALIVAFSYVYHYYQTYTFRRVLNEFQYKRGINLNGQTINPVWSFLRHYLGRILPFISAVYLAYRIVSNSSPSNFTYINTPEGEIIPILTSLFSYATFSIGILIGGLFSYLQLDLFAFLGETIRFQKKHSNNSPQTGVFTDDKARQLDPLSPLISATDQLPNLSQVPVAGFKMALSYLAIDIFLTIISVSDLPPIPGITTENIATLSTIIKVPYIIFLLSDGLLRFQGWLNLDKRMGIDSRTIKMARQQRESNEKSLYRLLDLIAAKRSNPYGYIDVSQNEFLLLLGAESSKSDGSLQI